MTPPPFGTFPKIHPFWKGKASLKKSEHCPPLYPPYPKFLQALRILLTPPESYYGLNSIKSNTNFTQNPYSSSLPAVCDVSPSSLPLSCLNSQLSLTSLHFPTTNPPSNCKPCQSRWCPSSPSCSPLRLSSSYLGLLLPRNLWSLQKWVKRSSSSSQHSALFSAPWPRTSLPRKLSGSSSSPSWEGRRF